MKLLGEVFYIGQGNVGIGTTLPRQQLDIQTGHVILQGNLGIGTTLPGLPLAIHSTSAILLPSGLTQDRPSNPETGTIRYNSQLQQFEGYGAGNQWGSLGGVRSTDQTTYITASNDSNLRFYTASTLQAILNPDGNLGIGTDTPAHTLHLVGSSLLDGPIQTNNNNINAGTATITANTFSGTATKVSNSHTAGQYVLGSQFDGQSPVTWDIKASSNATPETLVARSATGEILSSSLGIGTTASRYPLDIIGTAILTSGNLGIGTTTPDYTLHLEGNSYLNGPIITNNNNINAGTATITAQTFSGTATQVSSTLTRGSYLTGNNYNGASPTTWDVDATTTPTASKIVARDGSAAIFATALGIGTTATRQAIDLNNTTIITSGNLGIGTTTPLYTLHLIGNALLNGPIETNNNPINAGTATITAQTFSGTATKVSNFHTAGQYILGSQFDGQSPVTWDIKAASNATPETLVARSATGEILSSSLGIGTTTTRHPLDILGTAILTSGNLGIGTTTPDYTLHLEGNSYLNGPVITNNNPINAGTATITANTFSGTATQVSSTLTRGSYLTGNNYNGASPTTWAVDATTTPTASKIVARDVNAAIYAGNLGIGTTTARYPIDLVGTTLITNGNLGIGVLYPLEALHVEGNALFSGTLTTSNLSVIGTFTTIDTVTSNTDQVVITNHGTGPALKVTQSGNNTLAEFYDYESGIALYIANNGLIGIGTTIPTEALTVQGNITVGTGTVTAQTFSGTATKVSNPLTAGQYILGSQFDGQAAVTWDIKASSNATGETLVARSATGEILSSSIGIGTTASRYPLDVIGTSIITNGNLGIGTTSPLYNLHLEGNSYLNGPIITNNNPINAGTATITANTFSGTATQVSSTLTRGSYLTGNNYNGASPTTWDVDATTTPTASKIVARDSSAAIFATALGIGTTATRQAIDLNNTTIITSGNLGIGTTIPLYNLHLEGNSYLNGPIITNNNPINAGTATITANTFSGTATQVSSTLTRGSYLTGNNYNGASPTTWDVDATTTPTASKIVARDASAAIFATALGIGTTATRQAIDLNNTTIITSGNLGIGTTIPLYTLHLEGNSYLNGPVITNNNPIDAGTATITANTFSGTATQVSSTLTRGSYLTGNNYNGASPTTWDVDATTTPTASKIVARDASAAIFATALGIGTTATRQSIDLIGNTIITSGNLGIGTTIPLANIHLSTTSTIIQLDGTSAAGNVITVPDASFLRFGSSTSTKTHVLVVGDSFTGFPGRINFRYTNYLAFDNITGGSIIEMVRVTSTGNVGIGTATPRQKLEVTNGNAIVTGGKLGIGTTTPQVGLEVHTTDALLLPKGTEGQRPTPANQGYIRYNTSTSQFEGYGAGNAWGSLGGVKSTDQYTYITAELTAGANDSNIRFYTGTTLQAIINPQGNLGIGTTLPQEKLHVEGNAIVSRVLTASNIVASNLYFSDAFYQTDTNYYRSQLQIVPTRATYVVPPSGQSVFTMTVPGLYKVERADTNVFVNGFKLAYFNASSNDFDMNYTNGTSNTTVTVTTARTLARGDVVMIEAWPSYLPGQVQLMPGYVLQNISNTGYWNITYPSSNLTYTAGNVGIGTTQALSPLHLVGNMSLGGSIIPTTCNLYNLGSPDYRFKDLYLSGNSIDLDGAIIGSSGGVITMPAISVAGSINMSVDNSSNLILGTSNINVLQLPVEAVWSVRVDGPSTDTGNSVAIDRNSNVYIGANYASTTTSPIIYNANNTNSGLTIRVPSSTGAYAVKYNSDGTAQWGVSVDGTLVEQSSAVAADNQENFYFSGQYNGAATIYNANNVDSTLTLRAPTGYAGYVIKYNSSGAAQWAVSADSAGNDNNFGMTVDTSLNAYLAGDYSGTLSVYDANNTLSALTCRTSSSRAAYLVKYNSSGIAQWTASVDSTGTGSNDSFSAVTTDINNNVYIAGNYTSTATNVAIYNAGNTLSLITLRPSTGQSAFAIKYDSAGTAQFAVSVDGLLLDQANAIALDTSGNIYLAGTYSNLSPSIYNSNNTLSPISLRNTDGGTFATFLIKYDSVGFAQWATSIDGTGGTVVNQETALAINVDSTNNVYVSGNYITGQATVYNANNTPSGITLRQPTGTGGTAAFAVKYNPNGSAQWAISVDGGGSELGEGVFTDLNNNVYLGGTYGATPIIYNPNNTPSSVTLPATAGSTVAYIVKYRANEFKLLNNLTQQQQGTLKYVYNTSTSPIPLSIRNSTDTTTVSTLTIPANAAEQLFWYNNTWQSLTPTLSPLKGGTGNSNLPYNKLLVTNGPTDSLLTPTNLHWDNLNSRLGIGTTIPNYTLQVQGDLFVSGAFLNPSDQRLKNNLEVIPNALDKISRIQGYTYTPVSDPTKRYAGVLAQELKEVLPEAVRTDEAGNLAVAYDAIIPLLIQAIKELRENKF